MKKTGVGVRIINTVEIRVTNTVDIMLDYILKKLKEWYSFLQLLVESMGYIIMSQINYNFANQFLILEFWGSKVK